MIIIEMLRNWKDFKVGHIGPIDRALALRLIQIGVAKRVESTEVDAKKSKFIRRKGRETATV